MSSDFAVQVDELASTSRTELCRFARRLGIDDPELLSVDEIVEKIFGIYNSDGSRKVNVSNLPTVNQSAKELLRDASASKKRKRWGKNKKTDWVGKHGMPFRPKSDQGIIWAIFFSKSPVVVRGLEDKIRDYFITHEGKLLGFYSGPLLYYLMRNACKRGWKIEWKDKKNPDTFGELHISYVGEPTEPPNFGVTIYA